MVSINHVNVCLKFRKGASHLSADFRNLVRLFAVVVTAVGLTACAQSSLVTNKTALQAANRQRSVMVVHSKRNWIAHRRVAGRENASYGLASFYREGSETASGEKFDPNQMTAAHPSLPFGTRLRVTNISNGRSAIVRVNDRGPFVAGRTVDVSQSAAERIGIVERGVAKVKLEVVQ